MDAGDTKIRVLLIEDDAPVMRLMAWALSEDGFEVQVVSTRRALELHGLDGCDVAVFNMKATADEKSGYNRRLRSLDPGCLIIDVDEFAGTTSVRDSGADGYTVRPLNIEALVEIIRVMSAKSVDERLRLRTNTEHELRPFGPDARLQSDGDEIAP